MKRKPVYMTLFILIIYVLGIRLCIAIIPSSAAGDVYLHSQAIAAFFVIAGVVVALFQYISSLQSEKVLRDLQLEEIKKDRTQKAIDLAQYYKDNIIDKAAIIMDIAKNSKLDLIFEKTPSSKISNFDESEMKSLISEKDRETIRNTMDSPDFIFLLSVENIEYRYIDTTIQKEIIEFYKKFSPVQGEEREKKVSEDAVKYYSLRQYEEIKNRICNNLEYFAMHFTEKTADESVVYPSIHQTYLRLVKLLYFDICQKNSGPSHEKYFTNVAALYKIWREKTAEKSKEEELRRKE